MPKGVKIQFKINGKDYDLSGKGKFLGANGGLKLTSKHLDNYACELNKMGVKVVHGGPEANRVLDSLGKNKTGAFNNVKGIIYLRDNATLKTFYHEMIHARDWHSDKARYWGLSQLQREEHVLKELEKLYRQGKINKDEWEDSLAYFANVVRAQGQK